MLPLGMYHLRYNFLELLRVILHLWDLLQIDSILPNLQPMSTIIGQILQNGTLEYGHSQTVNIRFS